MSIEKNIGVDENTLLDRLAELSQQIFFAIKNKKGFIIAAIAEQEGRDPFFSAMHRGEGVKDLKDIFFNFNQELFDTINQIIADDDNQEKSKISVEAEIQKKDDGSISITFKK